MQAAGDAVWSFFAGSVVQGKNHTREGNVPQINFGQKACYYPIAVSALSFAAAQLAFRGYGRLSTRQLSLLAAGLSAAHLYSINMSVGRMDSKVSPEQKTQWTLYRILFLPMVTGVLLHMTWKWAARPEVTVSAMKEMVRTADLLIPAMGVVLAARLLAFPITTFISQYKGG